MQDDPQPEPVAELLSAAQAAIPGWLRRCATEPARLAGVTVEQLEPQLTAMVAAEAARLGAALRDLLTTDVDEQRVNPLALFRAATAAPTALLAEHGVPAPRRDQFAIEAFPHDVYAIIPATWADIDPTMHMPGITWGAWKAMTVLRRRRPAGPAD